MLEEPQAANGAGAGRAGGRPAGEKCICRFAVASDGTTMELESGPSARPPSFLGAGRAARRRRGDLFVSSSRQVLSFITVRLLGG